MATPTKLGDIETAGSPRYHRGMVWFRRSDDRLTIMPIADPSKAVNPNGIKTLSDPVPLHTGPVVFRGEGDKLMMMLGNPPYLHGQIGNCITVSAPVPCEQYIYFRSTDNKLQRVKQDGTRLETLSTSCETRPAISSADPNTVYYGSGDQMRWLNIASGSVTSSPWGRVDSETLFKSRDGNVYFTRWSHLYRGGSSTSDIPADSFAPMTRAQADDSMVYYTDRGKLCRVPNSLDKSKIETLLESGARSAVDAQAGFVLYAGTDHKIYKLAVSSPVVQ